MKQQSRIQLPWGLGTYLTLALLTLILLRVIVLSIRTGSAETELFVEFYLLSMPLDIITRRCFKKMKPLPWYYWAGWICRWAGIVMIALSLCHLALGEPWETLLVPEVYDSELWTDKALVPLRWIFSICGAGAGYILFQLIDLIFDGIKAIQKKRKERKEKMSEKPEEDKRRGLFGFGRR